MTRDENRSGRGGGFPYYDENEFEHLKNPSISTGRPRRSMNNNNISSSPNRMSLDLPPRGQSSASRKNNSIAENSQSSWFPLPSFATLLSSAPSDEAGLKRNQTASPVSNYGSPYSRDSGRSNVLESSPEYNNSRGVRSAPYIDTKSRSLQDDENLTMSGTRRLVENYSPPVPAPPSASSQRGRRQQSPQNEFSTNSIFGSLSREESMGSSDHAILQSNSRTRSRSYSRSPSPTVQRPKRSVITDETRFHNLLSSGTSPDDTQFLEALEILTNSPNPRALVEKQISNTANWNALHIAALSNPPLYLIYALLLVYPEAVKVKDSEGRLPIHLAAGSETSLSVLNTLVRHFPNGICTTDANGFVPIHLALLRDEGDEIPVDVLRVLLGQNIQEPLKQAKYQGTPIKRVKDGYMRHKNHLNLELDQIHSGMLGLNRNSVSENERKRREDVIRSSSSNQNEYLSRGFGVTVDDVDPRDANPLKYDFLASLWHDGNGPNESDDYADFELKEIDNSSSLVRQRLKQLALWKKKFDRNNPVQNVDVDEIDVSELINPATISAPPFDRLPLHMAVRRNHKKGQSLNDAKSSKLRPPPNQNSVLRILIHAYPPALMIRDNLGQTPLMTCLQLSHHPAIHPVDVDMIELLLGIRTPGFVDAPRWLEDDLYSNRYQDDLEKKLNTDVFHTPTNPAMIACEDRLPLHIAAREALEYGIIHTLYSCYPGAKYIQDDRKCTPLHCYLENMALDERLDLNVVLMLLDDKVLRLRNSHQHNIYDLIVLSAKSHRLPTKFKKHLYGEKAFLFQSIFENQVKSEVFLYPSGSPIEDRFFQSLQILPSWLRFEACGSLSVQQLLRRELSSTGSTMFIILYGGTLIAIIALYGSLVDSFISSSSEENISSTSDAKKISIIVLSSYLALSEFVYILVVANIKENVFCFYSSVSILSVILCCVTISRLYILESQGDKILNSDEVLFKLSTATIGVLWFAFIGYLARFWYGVGIFCSKILKIIQQLISPLLIFVVLTYCFMQMIYISLSQQYDTNLCVSDIDQSVDTTRVCSLWDSFKLFYLLFLGDLPLGDSSSKSTVVGLLVLFILSTFILALATVTTTLKANEKGHSLVKSFWVPLLTYSLFMRNLLYVLSCGNRACFCRFFSTLENNMGNIWAYIMIAFTDIDYKDTKWWYMQRNLGRPHLFTSKWFIQTVSVVIIPVWIIIGLVSFGILWPPQIRWWLFSFGIDHEENTHIHDIAQDQKDTNDIKSIKLMLYEKFHDIERELSSIKSVLK